jgi:lipopolysaccharide transport system permease protein
MLSEMTTTKPLPNQTTAMREEIAELWRFRYLLQMLVARELKVRYKNSVLGFLWSIVPPLLSVLVISFMVKNVLGSGIKNYSPYLLCGIIPWTFFSTAVLECSQSLLNNYTVIKKVYMPREVIPLAIVISNFTHFLLGWLVYFVAIYLTFPILHKMFPQFPAWGAPLLPRMVWFPLIVLAELLLVVGCSLWCAALNMFYEDVRFILQTLFSLVYFVLPILYTVDAVRYSVHFKSHPWLFNIYMLNPISAIITAFRWALLEPIRPEEINRSMAGAPPVNIAPWVYFGAFLVSLLIAWSGYAYFNSRKWKFVERS